MQLQATDIPPIAQASAEASDAVGWEDLREGLLALSNLLGIDLAYEDWLQPFCEIMCRQLFPEFAKLVLQRMLEVIQLGSASYQRAAVAVIKAIFEVRGRSCQLGCSALCRVSESNKAITLHPVAVCGRLQPCRLQGGRELEDQCGTGPLHWHAHWRAGARCIRGHGADLR